MKNERPIIVCCRTCEGEDVSRDANAAWDVINQRWEIETVFDQGFCADCDGEARLVSRYRDTGAPVDTYDRFDSEHFTVRTRLSSGEAATMVHLDTAEQCKNWISHQKPQTAAGCWIEPPAKPLQT